MRTNDMITTRGEIRTAMQQALRDNDTDGFYQALDQMADCIGAVSYTHLPVGALSGMMCKHTVSIYDLINGYEEGRAIEPELWDEKIIDNINYLILLRAVLREERE